MHRCERGTHIARRQSMTAGDTKPVVRCLNESSEAMCHRCFYIYACVRVMTAVWFTLHLQFNSSRWMFSYKYLFSRSPCRLYIFFLYNYHINTFPLNLSLSLSLLILVAKKKILSAYKWWNNINFTHFNLYFSI